MMKKIIVSICSLWIICALNPLVSQAAEQKPIQIKTYHADVNGDGQNEKIQLKGILFSPDSNFYREIWTEITNKQKEGWKINYAGGGYDPTLQMIDLNHDNKKDIFYQSATGGSGGLYNYQLNTISQGQLKENPLPEQAYLSGTFEDNFNVIIKLTPTDKPITIDVQNRAEDYIRLGIYDKNGNLLESHKSVMIDPIAFFEPVLISKSKGYGLKSYQQISGAYHADRLGTVETTWYYENGEWIILQTKWIPST
ncbi:MULTISPECIES: hypothetical protein [Virgibacillus]|uniref:VCBS repeat-containing protein n=2 Tax=Virgibacillus TaxID=84406 RepID=A0A024QAE7_9BACI|nr:MULTISPECIES: hypothetical protein [Virgibacillus]CDQ39262.1 hypothetical protein BN990_01551 [Virgibacillus massiliensis]